MAVVGRYHRVSARVLSCAIEQVEVRGIALHGADAPVSIYHKVSAGVL